MVVTPVQLVEIIMDIAENYAAIAEDFTKDLDSDY